MYPIVFPSHYFFKQNNSPWSFFSRIIVAILFFFQINIFESKKSKFIIGRQLQSRLVSINTCSIFLEWLQNNHRIFILNKKKIFILNWKSEEWNEFKFDLVSISSIWQRITAVHCNKGRLKITGVGLYKDGDFWAKLDGREILGHNVFCCRVLIKSSDFWEQISIIDKTFDFWQKTLFEKSSIFD